MMFVAVWLVAAAGIALVATGHVLIMRHWDHRG
ncbi:hypothetical protein QO011_003947 [Labrys wisconsinensis]|uniref:NADH dehydrogenase subunit 6 n=1 Tax=Labrys wisconsinensis TaxID=425677 RepID=A0ABU0J9I1_9HYPH|nr:hypothetical protein [Labrys wisconsinensis]